jgi:hypothetical protein
VRAAVVSALDERLAVVLKVAEETTYEQQHDGPTE